MERVGVLAGVTSGRDRVWAVYDDGRMVDVVEHSRGVLGARHDVVHLRVTSGDAGMSEAWRTALHLVRQAGGIAEDGPGPGRLVVWRR